MIGKKRKFNVMIKDDQTVEHLGQALPTHFKEPSESFKRIASPEAKFLDPPYIPSNESQKPVKNA